MIICIQQLHNIVYISDYKLKIQNISHDLIVQLPNGYITGHFFVSYIIQLLYKMTSDGKPIQSHCYASQLSIHIYIVYLSVLQYVFTIKYILIVFKYLFSFSLTHSLSVRVATFYPIMAFPVLSVFNSFLIQPHLFVIFSYFTK